jgi:hypothetical protein
MKNNWNFLATLVIEVYYDEEEGAFFEAASEKSLPEFIIPILPEKEPEVFEIVIDFNVKGYYDSGSMYGGPDNLGYPPEGDEERWLDEVYILVDGNKIRLSDEMQEKIFDHYEDEVEEMECSA